MLRSVNTFSREYRFWDKSQNITKLYVKATLNKSIFNFSRAKKLPWGLNFILEVANHFGLGKGLRIMNTYSGRNYYLARYTHCFIEHPAGVNVYF